MTAGLTPEEIKELQSELRVGNFLTAKLTDQCRELEAQLKEAKKQEGESYFLMFQRIVSYFRWIKDHHRPLTFEEKDIFEFFEQVLKDG